MLSRENLLEFNHRGILKCARYAFMPNKLSLCGPDKNKDLFCYCVEQKADKGLKLILRDFQVLYPYLELIARSNKIRDVFDEKVVEAYWLGNELLENVVRAKLYRHLIDEQQLKKKLNKKLLEGVIKKIPLGAKPHHSFHVLNVVKRTGNWDIFHTLKTMDLCKISWGRIKEIEKPYFKVEYQPLVFENNQMKLGEPIVQNVLFEINQEGFLKEAEVGKWVSFHWGFACEVISGWQAAYLRKYTQESIGLFNLT